MPRTAKENTILKPKGYYNKRMKSETRFHEYRASYLDSILKKLDITMKVKFLLKTALLGTAKILRKVPEIR